MIDVPVLIVGGGPVGLTASIYLSLFGIDRARAAVTKAQRVIVVEG